MKICSSSTLYKHMYNILQNLGKGLHKKSVQERSGLSKIVQVQVPQLRSFVHKHVVFWETKIQTIYPVRTLHRARRIHQQLKTCRSMVQSQGRWRISNGNGRDNRRSAVRTDFEDQNSDHDNISVLNSCTEYSSAIFLFVHAHNCQRSFHINFDSM